MKRHTFIFIVLAAALLSCGKSPERLDLDAECLVLDLSLDGYEGVVDRGLSSVSVTVPENYDVSAMTLTSLSLSAGASSDISEGDVLNMLSPRRIRVTGGDVYLDWTLSVKEDVPEIEKPSVVYMGLAASFGELPVEEQEACSWMLANVPDSRYVSFAELLSSKVDLSSCRLLWWHFHRDGGVDGKTAFEAAAADAVAVSSKIKALYRGGMSLLLTRYAVYLPAYVGACGSSVIPNNCWGGAEDSPETTATPWYFIAEGHTAHPLYRNLVMSGTEGEESFIHTCGAGYSITNSTAQWHIGSDWGGYESLSVWAEKTGAEELGRGSDGAVVVWEFPRQGASGGIICIGSGCYDWYGGDSPDAEGYHTNVAKMTENAIGYLTE